MNLRSQAIIPDLSTACAIVASVAALVVHEMNN
jgi:hypothetical protein